MTNAIIDSVSFIGLGAMGYRMAAHLTERFPTVMVYNRTESVATMHAKAYGTVAVPLAEAVSADVIISCLPTSQVVEDLIATALPHLHAGSVWIDCTSGVPDSAKGLAKLLQKHGCQFLDAPVSGQTSGAEAGTLTVMVGGDADALAYVMPVLKCFAARVVHVGDSGGGFAVKAVNNALFAINAWATGEGLSILQASGVSPSAALECINHASGQSFASTRTFPDRILNRSFPKTFTLDLMAKDCGIAEQLRAEHKLPTPVLSTVAGLMQSASNQHPIGSADFSEFIKFYEQWTRMTLGEDK